MDSYRRVKEIKKFAEMPDNLLNLPEIDYEKVIKGILDMLEEQGRCDIGFGGVQNSGKSESAMSVAASVRSMLDVDFRLGRIYDEGGNPTFHEYLSITPRDILSITPGASHVKQHIDKRASKADKKSVSIDEVRMNRPSNMLEKLKEDAKEYRKRQDKEKAKSIFCEACDKEANEHLNASMLQVHHRDGNDKNNDLRNRLILCANHHQTLENWKKKELSDPGSLKFYHGNREALCEDVTDRFLLSMRLRNDGQIPFDGNNKDIPEWARIWMDGFIEKCYKEDSWAWMWRIIDHAHFSKKHNAIVFHPYRVDGMLVADLELHARNNGTEISICGASEWYPSHTFKIEVSQEKDSRDRLIGQ